MPNALRRIASVAVGRVGKLSQPSRERIAVTGFFLGTEAPMDRLLSRTYFELSNWAWAGYEDGEDHLVAFRQGLGLLKEVPTRAVDLGTGAGGTAALVAEAWPGARVTGIDSSRQMVKRARLRHRGLSNLDFVVGDGLRLALEDGSVELVSSLNYMPHPGEVRRILRPGSRVLVASTFQTVGSSAVAAQWASFGFALEAQADATVGSFEIYVRGQ